MIFVPSVAQAQTAGVTVDPTTLTVTEGGSATYEVVLTELPSGDVKIKMSFASDWDTDITISSDSLTFTTGNWNTAQTVTVSAAEDDDAIDGTATIEHAASGGGYDAVTVSSVTATESDNDTAGVTVTPTTLPVPEGSSATYTVVLDTQPSADVTIAVSLATGSDADITVSPTSLTFKPENWSTAQTVTVSAAEDDDETDGAATINHAASGGGYDGVTGAAVTATEDDNTDPQRAALVAIYNALGGDNWTDNMNWNSAEPLGEWKGVTTDPGGVVTRLELPSNNLRGEIPAEIGDLTGLERLIFSSNALTGSIPSEIGNLTRLEYLSLHHNALSGSIPTEIESLTSLEDLYLHNNGLSGSIPTEIGSLTSLEELWLASNNLSGPIPTQIENLTSLQELYLDDNGLSGEIPSVIWGMTNLQELLLHGNALTGSIPAEIGGLTSLEMLWLGGNDLTGSIPSEIGDMASLEWLDLQSNALSGSIPTEIGDLTSLEELHLNDNNLSGSIPAEIGDLTNLERLWLYGNALSGSIPTEIGSLTSLTLLLLDENALSGGVPEEIADLTDLTWLNLSLNTALTGELPVGLKDLPILILDIRNTCITTPADSAFQAWLAMINFQNISSVCGPGVTVTPTELSVPEGSDATYTVVLEAQPLADVTIAVTPASDADEDITVDETSLTFTPVNWETEQTVTVSAAEDDDETNGVATIDHAAAGGGYDAETVDSVTATEADNDTDPQRAALVAIYDATNGDEWDEKENWKSAEPIGTWHGVDVVSGVVTKLDLELNNLRGVLPEEIGDLTSLDWLDFEGNNLSGEIPASIGNLTRLEWLDLEDNDLSGEIPSEIGNLTRLIWLYLNVNDLSGEIPSSIGNLTDLNWLSLDVNELSGEIPEEIGQLTNLTELYLSNNDLSGEIPASIGNLTYLEWLDLEHNDLSGEIPASIGNLTNLEWLDLEDNDLSGEIPASTGNLTSLEWLDLSFNTALTGELPVGFKDLPITTLNILNTCITTPADNAFQAWLAGIDFTNIDKVCGAGVTVTPTALTIPEGSNEKYTVVLDTQPLGDVTITTSFAAGSDADITASPTSFTFTPVNWETAQEITVSAAEDADDTDGVATIDHAAAGGGYNDVTVDSVTVTEDDNDMPGVTVMPTTLTVPEGSSAAYTVVLDAVPSADVTIAVSLASDGDADITVNETSLTFTTGNWNMAQTVTVSAAADDDAENGSATIDHTASGGGYDAVTVASVTVTEADAQRAALEAIYDATDGDNWDNNTNWKSEEPVETWYAVTVESGVVTRLDLHSNNLTGEIPPEIGDLTNLQGLLFDHNSLSGEIPEEIGQLTSLEWLYLDHNSLSGEIPAEIGNMTSLGELYLEYNSLSGAIPASIGDLTRLRWLWLSNNSLSGSIPASIGNLTRLTRLFLDHNSLDGEIPEEIGNLTQLWSLWLNDNTGLRGELPAGVRHLPIFHLDIHNTCITTPSDSAFQEWLRTLTTFRNIDKVCGAGVTVTPTALTVPEGSTSTYAVVLDAQPLADVTISVSLAAGSDVDITADKPSLTFTLLNWNVVQEVTMSAAEDDDAVNGAATIEHAASGGDYGSVSVDSVTVTEVDNNTAGVTVTPPTLSVPEGSSAKYTVVLDTKPSADVTISLSYASDADADITADKPSLTFTPGNWNVAQEVTVSAAEDDDALNGSATIEHAVSGGDYAGVTASSVTATEADNDTAGVTVTPAALIIPEGSSEKYTVVLDTQPSADVTIALSLASGSDEDITVDKPLLTFTTGNWNVAQEVTVSAAEDDDALSGSATIDHAVSGGDYAGVTASSVTATEDDNDMTGVTVTPTGLTITEGSSEKYTVVLDTQPSANVTITASLVAGSDPDITIDKTLLTFTPDTWSVPQEVTASAAEDTDAVNGAATIEHAVGGGDYVGVTASSVTVAESDNDAAGVTINPTALAVAEGSSAKYTVVLTTQPSADVTIVASLASGGDADITIDETSLTFTPDTWNVAQEVTVSAAQDDDAIDGSATIDHAVSGGDYTGVTASSVTVTEDDNDTAGVTVTPTALAITEGSDAKYTVVLMSEPSDDVTIVLSLAADSDADITVDKPSLVFTPDNWNAAQEVTASAAEDDDATDGSATIDHAVSGGDYTDVTASSVTVTESDNDAAGVTVNPTALTVPEGSNAKYTVVLNTQPSANVTISVSLAAGSDTDITIDKPSLVFTTSNWSVSQVVTVSAAQDNDAANGAATIEHSASGGGYGGVTVSSVTATEADNDATGVTVTPTALTVPEGLNAKYTVVLNTRPSANVTISASLASGSDTDITIDKTSLTFTPDNWNAAQEVTVSAAEDTDTENGAATIEHSASGGGYGGVTVSSVTVTEADNDTAGVTVTPMALTIPEGGSAKYTVLLTSQPSDDVTISLSFAAGSDEDITVDNTSLTFTLDNWNVAQEVAVSAAEDTDMANGAATIEHAASGGGYDGVPVSSVTATELDNDATGVTVTPTTLTIPEGSNATYTVVLDAQPSADVTISASFASGSDEDITVDKTSLTFTPDNWNAAQEVTVSAAEDNDTANGAATIVHTATGGGYGDVPVSSVTATEEDNDTAGVTVTPTTLSVPEGGSATYTVALDTEPSADVTISLSFASGSDADITVDNTSLTFTPENWDAAQEVTVSAAEDDDALNGAATIEHAASGEGYDGVPVSSVTATEEDNDTRGVTVTPTALPVPEGGSATYTVALDTQPSGNVTIAASFAVGSDEDITVDKTSLTFTPENWSIAQEITVSAAVDYDTDDDAATLNHNARGGDYGGVAVADVVITVTDVIGGIDVSAWLARYSRVGADHLLSSVENRMESIDRGVSGAEASVAGQRIVFGDAPARPGMELSGASALWSASQDYLTASPSMDGGYGDRGGDGLRSGNSFGISPGLNAAASRYRNMTLRDALSRSAFRYARETSWGNSFGIWGQGAFSRFGGSEAGADLTGDVMSGTIGVDHTISGWLNGLAVSRSESEGAYRIAGEDSLSLSAVLTGVYPYARYNLTDRLRVWGTGGYGSGSLSLQGDSLVSSTSDLSMILGSVGMSGDIVSAGSKGFGLSWQTDAMLLRSSLASSGFLASTSAMVHRLRLSLESSYILKMGHRASLAPKVQVGVRQDGGDAEQGRGVDVAGGLGFIHTGWGLQAQVDMHGLVAHEDSDFEQWGVSGMILFDRAPSSTLGMSLRLIPSWGSPSSSMGGMRALWSRETMSGLAGFGRTDDDRSLRLDSRFDYGFAAGEHGVASPYASLSLSGNEAASDLPGADVEVGGGLGYSNRSLGLRMRAGMQGLMSDEAMAFDGWGASGVVFFDPDPSSPLGASFNVSQSWGMTPRTGFGGAQTMGFGGAQNMETMREREPLPRSGSGLSRTARYGQPLRLEGEMGYGFSSSGGKGVATPYAGVAFSEQGRSGLLLGFNFQTGRRFLLNLEGSTPGAGAISFDSMPEFRVRGLLKW